MTCEIVFWRGYRKARFYACTLDGAGELVALAESPSFRSPGKDIPDRTDGAVEAHEALAELLFSDGWQLARRGPAWYQATFSR